MRSGGSDLLVSCYDAVMEVRPYFLLGDLLANAGVGALAASVATWLALPSWPMAVGMFAGMVLGMIVGLVSALAVLGLLFGAMEVFVPCMLSGMFGGMTGAMGLFAGASPATAGALVGVVTLVCVYIVNGLLHGERRVPE